MDTFFEVVPYLLVVLFVLFGPWIWVWRINVRRRREREEDHSRWGDLTSRVYAIETAVKNLREKTAEAPQSKVEKQPPPQTEPPIEPSGTKPVGISAPTRVPKPSESVFSNLAGGSDSHSESAAPPPPIPARTSEGPVRPPSFAAVGSTPTVASRISKSSHDLEEMVGTNWLNKLGIVILVLGVAFFLAYQIRTLGPAGRVLIGYLTGGLLLGVGAWFERNEVYRILARAGIGGGWALLFFTTYAMYHVPAARVLDSQLTDLLLMLAVVAVMVWHTLRYRSQVVTGLAFLLAFSTVTVSHSNVYSLSAGAVLALGLVAIVGRMRWFELEVFGILASYLNHYLWLRPIIEPMRGHRHPFPEFAASAGILVLYWLVFRISYLFREPEGSVQERISTAAGLLNTALLLLLFKYQSTHPEWAFWALLTIGASETALGQLPVARRRRTAVIVLSTVGVVLLIAAFPFRYSGMHLSVFWLVEAEALVLIGVWTREVVFRRLGGIATVVAAGQIIAVDAARIYGIRMDGADVSSYPRVAMLFAVAAAASYANALWVLPGWKELFQIEFDHRIMARSSYAGALLVLIGAWIVWPETWTAVGWAAVGLFLAFSGSRWKLTDLGYQGNFAAAAATVRALAMNLGATATFHGLTLRLISIFLVAVLLYLASRWCWVGEGGPKVRAGSVSFLPRQLVEGSYSWAASFLLALLAWYELRPVSVAVAWAMGALILLEAGLNRKNLQLRMQAYVALLASFLRIWFVNLNASGDPGEISPRFYTIVVLTLTLFYAFWRLRQTADELHEFERAIKCSDGCAWLGTIAMAALIRFEVPADWVAAAWAALTLALLLLAWQSGLRIFLHQALLIAGGVLARTCLHNFYERSYFPAPFWESRSVSVGVVVALLFLSLPVSFQLRIKGAEDLPDKVLRRVSAVLVRRPEQLVFFVGLILLTVLLALEMRHGMVTLAWGVEGVAVFVVALLLSERSFRISGLGLLLLCVGKIVVVDVWRLSLPDRYVTFIVLGAALLLVSFLYTRKREELRRYI